MLAGKAVSAQDNYFVLNHITTTFLLLSMTFSIDFSPLKP